MTNLSLQESLFAQKYKQLLHIVRSIVQKYFNGRSKMFLAIRLYNQIVNAYGKTHLLCVTLEHSKWQKMHTKNRATQVVFFHCIFLQ